MTRPGARCSSAANSAASTSLGTSPTRATRVPRNGPPRSSLRGAEADRKRAENGERRQRRPLGLAERPDVVVAEHAVDAGLDRLSCGGERRVGRVAERRQHDAGADHHEPPLARRQRRADRTGRSPKAAGTTVGQRAAAAALDQLLERRTGRSRSAGRRPRPRRRRARSTPGSTHTGQVGETEADPPAHLFDDAAQPPGHRPRRRPRRPRRARSRDRRRPARTTSPSRPAKAASRARTPSPGARRRSAPSSRGARRDRAGRWGRRPCARSRRRSPTAPTWTRPSDHDAAADARAERDHHDVVEAAGGAEAVLGQHGEVGVVLDDDRPPGQAVADQARPVHARAPAAGWARSTAGPGGRPCRARRRRPGAGSGPGPQRCWSSSVHDLAPRPRRRGSPRSPRLPGRGRDARLGHHLVAWSRARRRGPWCHRCRSRRSRRRRRAGRVPELTTWTRPAPSALAWPSP